MKWWREPTAALTGSGADPSPAGSVPAAHTSAAAAASPPSNSAVPVPSDHGEDVRKSFCHCFHTASVLPDWPRASPGVAAVACAARRCCPAPVAEIFAGSVSAPSQHADHFPNQAWEQIQPRRTVTIFEQFAHLQCLTLTFMFARLFNSNLSVSRSVSCFCRASTFPSSSTFMSWSDWSLCLHSCSEFCSLPRANNQKDDDGSQEVHFKTWVSPPHPYLCSSSIMTFSMSFILCSSCTAFACFRSASCSESCGVARAVGWRVLSDWG